MKYEVSVEIEQLMRPKRSPEVALAPTGPVDMAEAVITNEVFFRAHIMTRRSDHHGEGPTPAIALVNAALHWERYEARR